MMTTVENRTSIAVRQRLMILQAVTDLVCRGGIGAATVARITARTGLPRATFHGLFSDPEECLLAVFDAATARAAARMRSACEPSDEWLQRVRGALLELLQLIDEEPHLARFCIVQSMAGEPSLLARRRQELDRLAAAVDAARQGSHRGGGPPALTAEAVVGGVVSILHTRLLRRSAEPFEELWGPLTSIIVLPYRGEAAARRALAPRSAGRALRTRPAKLRTPAW